MSQFDVHRNTAGLRRTVPYVVTVQSKRFDAWRSRVIIPLVDRQAEPPIDPELNPVFNIEGRPVVLHPLQIVAVRRNVLGDCVCSLSDDSDRIIAAIDLLISRAWG